MKSALKITRNILLMSLLIIIIGFVANTLVYAIFSSRAFHDSSTLKQAIWSFVIGTAFISVYFGIKEDRSKDNR